MHAVAELTGWGGASAPGRELLSEDLFAITEDAVLTRGLGRSYGDSALPPPGVSEVAGSRLADRILEFDPATGRIRVEAGLSLRELNRRFLPRRWFPPVTPGTQDVTIGGMIAADVHGKNHHRDGTFGAHVESIRIRRPDGVVATASRDEEPELFRATLGGMGLTGHVLEATFRMRRIPSRAILMESERIPGIEAFVARLKQAARDWPYTMGWIDCLSTGRNLGRGVLMRGRFATYAEAWGFCPRPPRPLRMPFHLPSGLLARPVVRLFNELYYRRPASSGRRLVAPEAFFYPLDAIADWNRLYGRRGFTQYQCVLPEDAVARGAARRFLRGLADAGGASFLTVIKDCGPEGEGILSFPRPGISIAADLPARRGVEDLVARLNEFVIDAGGRIYLAKDRYTGAEQFRRMEPRLAAFQAIRRRLDPDGRIRSAQSVRLLGDRE